jgi:caspase domain-containing protein
MCTFPSLRRLTLVFVLQLVLSTGAEAQSRFALLVGNQAYKEDVGPLRNPHNDVALIAGTLNRLGFKVTVIKDAGYKSIDTALKTHIQQVRRAGKDTISFFYYSGHGASDPETRINYLIPVDVESADDANLWTNSFELNDIVSKLREQAPEATHYVVFDACRDELRLTRQGNKALGAEKGFTPVSTVTGVMIAYATAPGRTASDVGQRAGPYATALAEEMSKPGVEAVTMFRNVQLKVKQTIGQDPWLSFPTLPAIYFAGKVANDEQLRQQQIETAFWESAKTNGSSTLLSTYIERYPTGAYVTVARTMIQDLERKQAQEAAQVARAEQQREAARIAAERAAKEAQLAREELAKKQQVAAKPPAAKQLPSVDAEQLKAIEQELKLAREEAHKAEAQRQAALSAAEEARTKVGKVQRPSGTSTLARDIQAELKRLGCFAGDPDPTWTPKASEALARYLKAAKQTLPSEGLTPIFLEQLKSGPARSCPTPCGSGEKFADGKCVALAPQAAPVAPPVVRNNSGSGGDSCAGRGGRGWICKSIRSSKGLN